MTKDQTNRFAISKLLSKLKLSDALVIALVPFAAYLLIFTYYSGYFSVFGIPLQLIDFELNLAFIVIAAILAVALGAFFWGDIAFSFSRMFPGVVSLKLRRVVIITILAVGIMPVLITSSLLRYWVYILLLAFLLIFLLEFVPPIFLHRGEGGYIKRLEIDEKERNQRKVDSGSSDTWVTPLERLMMVLGPEIGIVGMIFIVVFGLGRFKALSQEKFLIIYSQPEEIILYMSSNKAIVAPYNRETNQVITLFKVIRIDDDPLLNFYSEKIGPVEIVTGSSFSMLKVTTTPIPSTTNEPISTATPTPKPTPTPSPTSLDTQPSTLPSSPTAPS